MCLPKRANASSDSDTLLDHRGIVHFLFVWGAKDGAVVRALASHQRGPGSNPGVDAMWVEFVVGSLLCSAMFFSGYYGFPLSSKTNISKFQFDQETGRRRTTLWMCYLQIIIYLFIVISGVILNHWPRC